MKEQTYLSAKMEYHLLMLLVFFSFSFSIGLQPADRGANAKTKSTLDFIGGLPKQGIIIEECSIVSIHNVK